MFSFSGRSIVARATPDGHTLICASSSLAMQPSITRDLSYDPARDFAAVTQIVNSRQILVVSPAVPAKSVREFVALAKSKPKQVLYGSAGFGTVTQLAMELLAQSAGVEMTHVPYKGAGPAITAVMAGQVQLMFNTMPTVLPHVKTGRLRALAVGSARRAKTVPDIPTVAESGVPGFEATTWWGMVAPAKTPASIIAKLGTQIERVLTDPEISQRMLAQGAEVQGSSPESLAKFMREESARMRKVIASAGIKAE